MLRALAPVANPDTYTHLLPSSLQAICHELLMSDRLQAVSESTPPVLQVSTPFACGISSLDVS
jgi:hypothetical protein